MSETNTTSIIDQMVAASGPAPAILRPNTTADMRMNSEGEVTVLAPAAHAGYVGTAPGLNLTGALENIDTNINRITAELAEQKFDPKTGAAKFVREGSERSVREAQLVSLRAAREYQQTRNAEIEQARAAEAAAKQKADAETAARHVFTQGNPARAAALDAAIRDEEARAAAAAIVAGRRG